MIVAYHGAHYCRKEPKLSRASDYGPGFYFTSSKADAEDYGPCVYKVAVNIQRPFVPTREMSVDMQRIQRAFRINDEDLYFDIGNEPIWARLCELIKILLDMRINTINQWIGLFRKMGYDGIIIPNWLIRARLASSQVKTDHVTQGDYIIAFDKSQIIGWEYVGKL
jgi:hypothetical protein